MQIILCKYNRNKMFAYNLHRKFNRNIMYITIVCLIKLSLNLTLVFKTYIKNKKIFIKTVSLHSSLLCLYIAYYVLHIFL